MPKRYLDTGGAALPAVVFLHAFPLDYRMWEAQAELLRGVYRVIAPDLRGSLIDLSVDDLFALLDEHGISTATFCGLSMGGYVALRALERDPNRCKALILCDTRAEADTNAAKLKRADSIRLVKNAGTGAFVEPFLKSALSANTFSNNPTLVERVRKMALETPAETMISALIALSARTDSTALLPQIRVPTLILVGEGDSITPPAEAEKMRAAMPGAELKIIPNAGHYSNLENPEGFNRELKGFLDKVHV